MSYRKIFWGVLLVFIGALFILKNTGVIFFSWHTVWNLWPVLLILWGISVLPMKDWIKVVVSLATIIITFLAVQQFGRNDNWKWKFNFRDKDWDNDTEWDATDTINQAFDHEYDSTVKYANLNLNIGVGKFRISDTTSRLIDFVQSGSRLQYNMTVEGEDSTRKVQLSMKEGHFQGTIRNDVKIKLNPAPVWDLNLEVGAAEVDFDLSGYRTKNVDISGGASDIRVKLGTLMPESNVRVKAGAASITILIPKTSGCKLEANTFLASKDFEGFEKKSNRNYQTPGFEANPNKINISAEAGMASIKVERY